MTDQETIANLERVWRSIDKLCESFTEREWKMPTDLPGWSVQDNLVHIIDYESRMLKRPIPEHTPPERPHMQNDLGQRNEIWVDWCRPWPGSQVLEAYREVIAERLRVLRTVSEEELRAPSPASARGEALRDHLQRRLVDCWTHEQDIRRAISRPGHVDGPVVEHALGRMVASLGAVVGREALVPDGSTVVFVITGPFSRTVSLTVEGGRAHTTKVIPQTPTARLSMDCETFALLVFGRWGTQKMLESGRVLFAGDVALGRTMMKHMALTP